MRYMVLGTYKGKERKFENLTKEEAENIAWQLSDRGHTNVVIRDQK
jgi:hypothetical protein